MKWWDCCGSDQKNWPIVVAVGKRWGERETGEDGSLSNSPSSTGSVKTFSDFLPFSTCFSFTTCTFIASIKIHDTTRTLFFFWCVVCSVSLPRFNFFVTKWPSPQFVWFLPPFFCTLLSRTRSQEQVSLKRTFTGQCTLACYYSVVGGTPHLQYQNSARAPAL